MSRTLDDTGLHCPWCDYNLTALTGRRCPECGKRFVLARPGAASDPVTFAVSTSMICPECGRNNTRVMPRRCHFCSHPFAWRQRIFGISR